MLPVSAAASTSPLNTVTAVEQRSVSSVSRHGEQALYALSAHVMQCCSVSLLHSVTVAACATVGAVVCRARHVYE
eukprot:14759-Heterococcus_DN1.PRE.2